MTIVLIALAIVLIGAAFDGLLYLSLREYGQTLDSYQAGLDESWTLLHEIVARLPKETP